MILSWALTLFAVTLGLLTFLGWFGRFNSVLEAPRNAAPHFLVAGIVLTLWGGLARRFVHAGVGMVVVVWFAFLLAPYLITSSDPLPPDEDGVHSALQYNVFFDNENFDETAALIIEADADVVALHEITNLQWDELSARLPDYPFFIAEPFDGGTLSIGGGMALLSRTPLEPIEVDPEANVFGRPILAASTFVEGNEMVFVGLHPHASRHESDKIELRGLQLEAVADLLRDEPRPAVVLTDMNITPTSPDYSRFLSDIEWRDPHRITGWDASFPAGLGPFGIPIDHVFVSDSVALHDVSTGESAGSDHRSLVARFSVRQ